MLEASARVDLSLLSQKALTRTHRPQDRSYVVFFLYFIDMHVIVCSVRLSVVFEIMNNGFIDCLFYHFDVQPNLSSACRSIK